MSNVTSKQQLLVASLFVRLPRNNVKHAYAFGYKGFQLALDVPAPYELFCSPQVDCEQIRKVREAQNETTATHALELDAVWRLVARRLHVTVEQLRRATTRSIVKKHCPSAELVLIWLAKPLIVELAMKARPEHDRFAWLDTGFNVYRVLRRAPARPPPWDSFWPERGLAVRMLPGACHNDPIRPGVNHSRCPVGTFLYGTRASWHAFNRRYLERVRELVVEDTRPGMLCLDQDVIADVLARHPDEHLAEEFTTSDLAGWGWRSARRANVTCVGELVNMGNRCVNDSTQFV